MSKGISVYDEIGNSQIPVHSNLDLILYLSIKEALRVELVRILSPNALDTSASIIIEVRYVSVRHTEAW